MPSTQSDRARRHQSQTTNEPNNTAMRSGQESVQMVRGRGLRKVVRHSGKDYYQLMDDTGAGQVQVTRISLSSGNVATGTAGGTTTGVTVHSDLTGNSADDHTQYVHNSTARTITANHAFTGAPSFNNINIDGGDIAVGTVINKSPQVNFNSGDVTGSMTLTNLADATGSLTIGTSKVDYTYLKNNVATGLAGAGMTDASGVMNVVGGTAITANANDIQVTDDSIGDTQLAYNTGQHLTTTSAVTFATVDTGQGANELYDMNQNVLTTSDVTFDAIIATTLDTGQGANELFDMDQNVLTTSSVAFAGIDLNGSMTVTGDITGDSGNLTVSSSSGNTLIEGTTFNGNNVSIPGDLTVLGDTVTLDTETLQVEDQNIYLAYNNTTGDTAAKNTAANAGGISLRAAEDKHFVWYNATDRWTASEDVEAPGLYLNTNTETKITLHDTAGPTDVTIGTSNLGDLILTAVSGQGVTVSNNNHLGGTTFASGFTGSGWRITKDASNEFNAEFDNLFIRGTLSVYELLIQQIRATNGSIFVSSSAKVESSSGLSASDDDGTITFEDPSDNNICPFADGDIIMMQRIQPGSLVAGNAAGDDTGVIKKLVYEVTGISGKVATVTGAGYNNLSYPLEGDDFVRLGNTGDTANRDGIIYLTSDDSGAPFIDIKNSINSYSEWHGNAPKVRLGKLDGITHNGNNLSGFGLFGDRVWLTGDITATSGYIGSTDQGWTISSDQIHNGKFKLNANSETLQLGDVVDFTNDDNTKSGIFMGLESSGNYDFFIGKEATEYVHWDDSASKLYVKGDITVTNSEDFSSAPDDATDGMNSTEASIAVLTSAGLEVKNDSAVSLALFGATMRVGKIADDHSRLEVDALGNLEIINRQTSTDTPVISLDKDGNATFTGTVTATDGFIGGWELDADTFFTGTKVNTGGTYSANGSITLNDNGELHTPTFYVKADGTSAFKGTVYIGSDALDASNTLNTNTEWSDVSGTTNAPANNADVTNYATNNTTTQLEAGVSLSSGGIVLGTTSSIKSGQSAYNTGTGFWLEANSGTPRFSLGNPSGNHITWNGSVLAVAGSLTLGTTALTTNNTLNENTTKADVELENVANENPTTLKSTMSLNNVDNKSSSTLQTDILNAADADDVGLGNVDNTSDASVLTTAATAANEASKTDGYVGGWEISSTAILGVADGAARIVMTAAGDIVTNQWAIKRDGSASFANNSITFETNGDITSNEYLIERTRLFGAGQDSYNGSSYVDTWISTTSRYSAYGENTYSINVAPETQAEIDTGYGGVANIGPRIMEKYDTAKWRMVQDAYFKDFTVKTGVILHTQGYRIFCSGTLTIESGATIQNNGSSIVGVGTATGAAGAPSGTLKGGAQGANHGTGGGAQGGGSDGGDGGAGGGGAGIILISARYISNSGTIRATGGNGGQGEGTET